MAIQEMAVEMELAFALVTIQHVGLVEWHGWFALVGEWISTLE
jgi:hypothetical protein